MQTKKNNWKALVLLLPVFICLSFNSAFHPFYISVSEIKINPSQKTAELSCKLFTDDIQEVLHQEYKQAIHLSNITPGNQSKLEKYIQQHLKVYAGAQAITFQCIGYEIEEEAVWVYLEGKVPNTERNFSVNNTLLCEQLSGQTNIVHFTYNHTKKSSRVICPDKQFEFSFE